MKLGNILDSKDGIARTFTPATDDIDSFIETILVLSGERVKLEQNQIPDFFWPVTGKWKMRGV